MSVFIAAILAVAGAATLVMYACAALAGKISRDEEQRQQKGEKDGKE